MFFCCCCYFFLLIREREKKTVHYLKLLSERIEEPPSGESAGWRMARHPLVHEGWRFGLAFLLLFSIGCHRNWPRPQLFESMQLIGPPGEGGCLIGILLNIDLVDESTLPSTWLAKDAQDSWPPENLWEPPVSFPEGISLVLFDFLCGWRWRHLKDPEHVENLAETRPGSATNHAERLPNPIHIDQLLQLSRKVEKIPSDLIGRHLPLPPLPPKKKIKWIIEIRNEFRKEFVPHADECPSPKWRTWNPGRRHGFHFFSHSLKPNEGLPDENWPDGSKRWRCETFNTIKNSQSWNMASENPIFGCCWKMRLTGNKTNSK